MKDNTSEFKWYAFNEFSSLNMKKEVYTFMYIKNQVSSLDF